MLIGPAGIFLPEVVGKRLQPVLEHSRLVRWQPEMSGRLRRTDRLQDPLSEGLFLLHCTSAFEKLRAGIRLV
jgi:hypothetical protein